MSPSPQVSAFKFAPPFAPAHVALRAVFRIVLMMIPSGILTPFRGRPF